MSVFVVADVPGLIPGASRGKGLGLDFLRHVEAARCSCMSSTADPLAGRDPVTDLDVLEAELGAYEEETGAKMAGRPKLVVLNKIDVPEARDLAEIVRPDLEARGLAVLQVSAATGEGLRELAFALAAVIAEATERRRGAPAHPAGHPARADGRPQLRWSGPGENKFAVRGAKPFGGSGRPTSATTRRSDTWPTGWRSWASRRRWTRRRRTRRRGADRRGRERRRLRRDPKLPASGGGFGPRGTDPRLEHGARRPGRLPQPIGPQ